MKKILLCAIILLLIIPLGTAISEEIQQDLAQNGKAKVIITLKEPEQLPQYKGMIASMNAREKATLKLEIKEQAKASIQAERIKHDFESFNGFSASITPEELVELEKNSAIASIEYDYPVQAFLQTSTNVINATTTWTVQENGINLTGLGETICIIDTGINYTHESLGGCTIENLSLEGNIEPQIIESVHPYANNQVYNWTITMPGFERIAIHFANISTEPGYDYVQILDGNDSIIAVYSGLHANIWTPSAEGDTIKIRLISDESINDYGFYADQVINGTTTTTYDWSSCAKVIGGWDITNGDGNPYDDEGHGTHVSGIAAGTNNIRGVAPDANIVAVKALNSSGGGTISESIAAIEWCANRSQEYNISVISMSLGGGSFQNYCDSSIPSLASAINNAVAKNITVVTATGNDGSSTNISIPACIRNATRVGRTSNDDSVFSGGNRGANFDILMAPGTSINSTCMNGGYCVMGGTSMSTPHVAGAAALLQQFKKLQNGTMLTKFEIENALNSTGVQVYDSASGKNYSRINIYASITLLDESPPTLNITKNASYVPFNTSGIIINWTATDNLGISTTSFNITYPNGTILFSSSLQVGSIELNSTNLTITGTYNISLWSNDSSGNEEYLIDYFEVTNTTPVITMYEPEEQNITLYLGNNISFNTSSEDPLDSPLYYYWYINSGLESQTENFTFYSNNYSTGNFTVEFVVSNNESNASNSWNVEVIHPYVEITLQEPNETHVTIRKNRTVVFNVSASDQVGNQIYYYWYINEDLNSTTQNFTFNTTILNISNYNLTLFAHNNYTNESLYWNVSVLDANRPVEFNDSKNISDYAWTQGQSLANAFNLSDYFYDEDNETFTYTLMNSTSITLSVNNNYASFSAPSSFYGTEQVWIMANDSETNASSNVFTLTVNQAPVSPSGGGSSGGGGGGGGGSFSSEEEDEKPTVSTQSSNRFKKIIEEANEKIEVKTNMNMAVQELKIFLMGTHLNVNLEIKDAEAGTSGFQRRKAYKTFEIRHENLENKYIENAIINFRVEKKWIQENNVNHYLIALFRQEDEYWNELNTRYLTDDEIYNYYEAQTPGLSLFLIGEREETQEEIKTDESPIQETEEKSKMSELFVKILAAIFSILAILLMLVIFDKIARKKALKMKEKLEQEKNYEEKKDSIPSDKNN